MPWLLWPLFVAALAGCVLAAVFARAMRRGDPAGNAMGSIWFLGALAAAWLLALVQLLVASFLPMPADAPAVLTPRAAAAAGFVLASSALAAQVLALSALLGRPGVDRRGWRAASMASAPFAVALHAAWRGIGVPSAPVAIWVCGGILVVGAVSVVRARVASVRPVVPAGPVYPALVIAERHSVHVVRHPSDLVGLPADLPLTTARLVDASGVGFALVRQGDGGLRPVEPAAAVLSVAAVRDLLLQLPALAADAGEDARIRRRIAMQPDVTSLTFVLSRGPAAG